MFCKYCGHQLAEGSVFCPSCGKRLDAPQQASSQNSYTPPQQTPPTYQQSGDSGQQGGYTPPSNGGYQPPQANSGYNGGYSGYGGGYQPPQSNPGYGAIPMNWYKFLIYFALFASCVLNAITGLALLTGAIYGDASGLVYSFYGALKIVDLLIGAVMIAVAVLAIITRQKLAKFKADGPSFLMILYGVNIAATVLYLILATLVVGDWLLSGDVVSQYVISTAVSIVMIVVNNIYFKKRASMFVN